MNRSLRLALAAFAVAAFAACAGGYTGSGVVPGHGGPVAAPVPAAVPAAVPDRRHRHKHVKGVVRFIIPPRVRHHKSHYISGATLGARIVAAGGGMSIGTNFNLSPLSGNCPAGSGGVHICTIAAEVPVGDDTFTVTFYDKTPSGGGFAGANILSMGSVTQTVGLTGTPSIVIYAGGVIGAIGATPAFASLPADGITHGAAFAVAPTDFGNQPITAGKKDPYHNPITVTLTESGGSGNASLIYNGGSPVDTATLVASTDRIAVQYDGAGSPGYFIKVDFSASGAPTQHLQVAPMFVTSASNMFNGTKLQLVGTGVAAAMTVSEAGNSGSQTYTSVPNAGCAGVATSHTVSDSGGTAVFTIGGGATAAASGCSIAFSDGVSTIHIPATNTLSGGGVGLPGSVINTFPVPNPVGISTAAPTLMTVGPDQQLWLADSFASVQSSSTSGTFATYLLPANPSDLTAGPDGAIWIADPAAPSNILRLIGGAVTSYPVPAGTLPNDITNGPDGALWFTDTGCGAVDRMSITGTVTQTLLPNDAANPAGIAAGPDNALWFTESATGVIGRLATGSFALTETTTLSGATSAPQSIALGPDGQMWYTESGSNVVGSISTNGSFTLHEYPVTGSPSIIARGPDNAMYFITTGANPIGRIDVTTHALSYFPTAATPAGIVTGPDGNIWYTMAGSQLVQMTP